MPLPELEPASDVDRPVSQHDHRFRAHSVRVLSKAPLARLGRLDAASAMMLRRNRHMTKRHGK